MQKALDGLIFLVLCLFLLIGCQKKEDNIHFEEIANATKIEVTHSFNGTVTTETIEDTDNINQIANWLNELLLDEISFPENETPSDTEGGECYSFLVSDSEGKQTSFNYYINGSDNYYILYGEEWYIVKNPVALTL